MLSDQYTPAQAPAPTYLLSNQLCYVAQKLGRPRACILNHTMLYYRRQPARVAQWQSSRLLTDWLEVRVLSRAFLYFIILRPAHISLLIIFGWHKTQVHLRGPRVINRDEVYTPCIRTIHSKIFCLSVIRFRSRGTFFRAEMIMPA